MYFSLVGVRRDKGIRVWVTDFAHVKPWARCVYVASVPDVYSYGIVARHPSSPCKATDLVMTPLR